MILWRFSFWWSSCNSNLHYSFFSILPWKLQSWWLSLEWEIGGVRRMLENQLVSKTASVCHLNYKSVLLLDLEHMFSWLFICWIFFIFFENEDCLCSVQTYLWWCVTMILELMAWLDWALLCNGVNMYGLLLVPSLSCSRMWWFRISYRCSIIERLIVNLIGSSVRLWIEQAYHVCVCEFVSLVIWADIMTWIATSSSPPFLFSLLSLSLPVPVCVCAWIY